MTLSSKNQKKEGIAGGPQERKEMQQKSKTTWLSTGGLWVGSLVLAVLVVAGVRTCCEGRRQKTGAPSSAPAAEEESQCYFIVEHPLGSGEVTSPTVLKKHNFKPSQNEFEAQQYQKYKEMHGALVEKDEDAYGQIVATKIAPGEVLVKTALHGPVMAREIKVFVLVRASQLWQENKSSVLWGAEQVGAALKQEGLQAGATLLAKEEPGAATLEAVASTAVSGREAKCLIKAELRAGGRIVAILEGKSYERLDPKTPLNLFHQDEVLERLIEAAATDLGRGLQPALEKAANVPPPSAEEEEKPAEGTATTTTKPSTSRGWLWGVVVGLLWIAREIIPCYRKKPTEAEEE